MNEAGTLRQPNVKAAVSWWCCKGHVSEGYRASRRGIPIDETSQGEKSGFYRNRGERWTGWPNQGADQIKARAPKTATSQKSRQRMSAATSPRLRPARLLKPPGVIGQVLQVW